MINGGAITILGHVIGLLAIVTSQGASAAPYRVATVIQQEVALAGQVVTVRGVLISGRHGAAILDCLDDDEGIGIGLPAEPRSPDAERLVHLITSTWLKPRESPVWVTLTGRFDFDPEEMGERSLDIDQVDEIVEGDMPSWSVCSLSERDRVGSATSSVMSASGR